MRITGRSDVLPMIADCERGLGRPERALDIAASEAANDLGVEAAIELMMVVAGAYADTGDIQTALRTLEIPALRHKVDGRWQVRLWVAYADLLERAGREDEAQRWISLAADADTEGLTDAAERLGRPAPAPAEEPAWEGDEQISVLDAFDPSAEDDEDGDVPEVDAREASEGEVASGAEDAIDTDDDADDSSDVDDVTDAEAEAAVAADAPAAAEAPVDADHPAAADDAESDDHVADAGAPVAPGAAADAAEPAEHVRHEESA
jgi:hypothetical protein